MLSYRADGNIIDVQDAEVVDVKFRPTKKEKKKDNESQTK